MSSLLPTLVLCILSTVIEASLYYNPYVPDQRLFFNPHPKVLEVDSLENLLPDWQRNPNLKNLAFLMAHPLYSYPGHGEEIIYNRPTDRVERDEIYSMMIHAGFIRRNPILHSRFKVKGKYETTPHKHDADIPQYLSNSDTLQYV